EEELVGRLVEGLRAHGYVNDEVAPRLPVLVLPAAVLPPLGHEALRDGHVEEGRLAGVALEHHVSPLSAVAPRRPPEGHVLLPAKRDAAAPAVPGHHLHIARIDELHLGTTQPCKRSRLPLARGALGMGPRPVLRHAVFAMPFATGPRGVRIHYETQGAGRRTAVLIQGLGLPSSLWFDAPDRLTAAAD